MKVDNVMTVVLMAVAAAGMLFAQAQGQEPAGQEQASPATPAQEAADELVQGAGPIDYVAGASVTNIRGYAFAECRRLRSVVAEGATSVGQGAFLGCVALRSVSLPSVSGASLPRTAFLGCARLTEVRLPGVSLADAKTSGFPWQTPSQAVVFYLADGQFDRNGRKLD